jgi:hypothetical protein
MESPRAVLLLLDLLGVKAKWHTGGRPAAEHAFAAFEAIVREAVTPALHGQVISGLIETDSALFVCPTLQCAVNIGRNAYVKTFLAPQKPYDERLSIRGVIVPHRGPTPFRKSKRATRAKSKLVVSQLHNSVLDAVAAEKSGFRGMRLLVGGGSGTGQKARAAAASVYVKEKHYAPFLRVRTPQYPTQLRDKKFQDFMWMATDSATEYLQLRTAMHNRIKWSANDPEEFLQAASTQVVFNHWEAFVESLPTGRNQPSTAK